MKRKNDKIAIPRVNHLDFNNAKSFGEISIDSNIELPETDPRMIALEHNAKQACKLFIPFRKFSDLKTNGKYFQRLGNGSQMEN